MLRKIGFGFLWFVLFYFGTCVLIGAVAGGIAGSRDPQNASAAGAAAGTQAVQPLIPYILAGSLIAAVAGAATGFLPGTRKKVVENKS